MKTAQPRALLWLVLLSAGSVALALAAGSAGWGFASAEIVWLLRAPRAATGFSTGAALGLAGALTQLLTRNALADPYVLGVSGGAAVGALLTILLGAESLALFADSAISVGAGMGAAVATVLLLILSTRAWQNTGVSSAREGEATVLLIGVMIGSACAAVIALLLAVAPDTQLRSMVFWLIGDLSGASQWPLVLMACALALLLTWPSAHQLDWMARGDAWAITMGVPVTRRRFQVMLAAAVATGAAVAAAGAIGFVGLVVPHAMRMLGFRKAKLLLPACALAGGAFVVVADTAARTLVSPVQLPVGVLAAAVGVPTFLWLLLRRAR